MTKRKTHTSCIKLLVILAALPVGLVACLDGTSNSVGKEINQDGSNKGSQAMSAPGSSSERDDFDGEGELIGYTTNNKSSLPNVSRKDGRYHALLTNNNNNITLHFNDKQGRLDARKVVFPFEVIVRNIGIGTTDNSQLAPLPSDFSEPSKLYMFAGIQVHVSDLDELNSAHMVVGHRGKISYTVEGKNTVKGKSSVNDAGQGIVPDGRADLRLVGKSNKTLRWYWQLPNLEPDTVDDEWIPYRGKGKFPGKQAKFDDEVWVGIITYAFGPDSVPFVGTADSIEWLKM